MENPIEKRMTQIKNEAIERQQLAQGWTRKPVIGTTTLSYIQEKVEDIEQGIPKNTRFNITATIANT